jgi:energy-converting hydrogenase Eha subunit C
MKRIVLYASIVLIVIGIIGRLYANQYSHVTPEGMMVDSAWLPIGTLMILIGVLVLIVLGIVSAIGYLRNRLKR